MNFVAWIGLFLLACGVRAEVTETWLFARTELLTVRTPEGVLINPSCLTAAKCLALEALRNRRALPRVLAGGKNPGSDICKSEFKGTVIIAHRGELTQGFCQFPDQSFVSLDGITR